MGMVLLSLLHPTDRSSYVWLAALLERVAAVQAEGAKLRSDNETLQTCERPLRAAPYYLQHTALIDFSCVSQISTTSQGQSMSPKHRDRIPRFE